jgi:hypothetical protein
MNNWKEKVTLFAVLLSVWFQGSPEKPPRIRDDNVVYVGVIEDDRKQLDQLGPNDSTPVSGRTITPAFKKDKSGWEPLQELDQPVTWTVAFDGKNLASVESKPISRIAMGNITGPTNIHSILTKPNEALIPSVGKPDGRFSGNYGRIVRRPLVVVSKPNFGDPDHWKRGPIPVRVVTEVRASFRRTFQHLRKCDASGEALKVDWSIPDSDIVVSKSYISAKHEYIVETKVLHNKCLFNVNVKDLQSMGGNQTFFVSPNDQAVFLGLQWELLDAGDYDGDGKSEVIFYIAEGKDINIETEGYVLFYDDFRHSVRFVWQNH